MHVEIHTMKYRLPACSVLISLALLINFGAFAQAPASALTIEDVCLSPTEANLAFLINEYRKKKKLPEVPVSRSLSYVAQLHARDLMQYFRQGKRCNMHSWSDNGRWTSCCYTPDHRKASCMWNKPRELTNYKGDGFEIAFYSTYNYSTPGDFANDILKGWKESKGHNQVIINTANWKDVQWKAMGIGVYGEYAVVWFGEVPDSAGIPGNCTK